MRSLTEDYTIVILTHSVQPAARATGEDNAEILVEHGPFTQSFANPENKRTGDYIAGRFG